MIDKPTAQRLRAIRSAPERLVMPGVLDAEQAALVSRGLAAVVHANGPGGVPVARLVLSERGDAALQRFEGRYRSALCAFVQFVLRLLGLALGVRLVLLMS